jgi:hypothetical protein
MIESDDYKRGWYDGYQAARKDWTENFRYVPSIRQTIENRCVMCGKDLNQLTHYVCGQPYCPTKVSCSVMKDTPATIS